MRLIKIPGLVLRLGMNKWLSLLAAFLMCSIARSQDPADFFPHHLGDMWEYFVYDGVGNDTLQVRVVLDSLGTDSLYYIMHERQFVNPSEPPYFCWYEEFMLDSMARVSSTGCAQFDILQYKLDALLGEIWIVEDLDVAFEIARVETIYADTVFGIPTEVKSIAYFFAGDTSDTTTWGTIYGEEIASGFGPIYRGGGDLGYELYLLGAVIDGVLYGDTTLVTAEKTPAAGVPAEAQLSQNYPNPFNSETVIGFALSRSTRVTLGIYDVLGREVARLVSDQSFDPGIHELRWEGLSGTGAPLPSGVYYYRLVAGSFNSARSMLMIR